jgi:hypothetical protein
MASVSVTFDIPDNCPLADDPIAFINELVDGYYDNNRETMEEWLEQITYEIKQAK